MKSGMKDQETTMRDNAGLHITNKHSTYTPAVSISTEF